MIFPVVVGIFTLLSTANIADAALANVYTTCSKPNAVALTFDDGPYIYHQKLANTLQRYGVQATFFVNGANWKCIYDEDMVTAMRNSYGNGHEFGSHTWHHYHLPTLARDGSGGVHDEMWRTELALQRILGVSPALMRPPYGEYNDMVREVAALRNQSLVTWDMDSGDSHGISVDEQKANYRNVVEQHPGSILTLNHETYETTYLNVTPYAIEKLQAGGYEFVTISECLGIPAYQWVAAPQTRTIDWNCN